MKTRRLAGTSLIETILYLGIAVIILGVLFSYGWNVVGINIKAQVIQETERSAQLLGERLAYEIRRTDSVDSVDSSFGASAKLVLLNGDEVVVIEETDDQITIKRGEDNPVFLHPQDIKIRNFSLSRQVSDDDEIQFVGFSFEAVASYSEAPARSEYQYVFPFSSGASLR